MSVLRRVRRVGAIAASVTVTIAVFAMAWLVSTIEVVPGNEVLWQAGAFIGLLMLFSLCLLLALSAEASQRRAGPMS
jgi:hypothetical protein